MIDYSKAILNEGVLVIKKIQKKMEGEFELPVDARPISFIGEVVAANAKMADAPVEKGDTIVFFRGAGAQDSIDENIFYFLIDNVYLVIKK